MARRHQCKICGDDTGGPEFDRCGRCAQIRTPVPVRPVAPEPARAVVQATEETRRRWHHERVAMVRDAFERGRRVLLARALSTEGDDWAKVRH